MKSGKETTANRKSLPNTYDYTIDMLAHPGAKAYPPRSDLRDLDLFILIPAVRNTEPTESADNAGTCSLKGESAYRSALEECVLVDVRLGKGEPSMPGWCHC